MFDVEEVPADDDDTISEPTVEKEQEDVEVISGLNGYLDWIDWVEPFQEARARAEAEHRLLIIKPVAFGTGETCW